jgi:glycosyltransferase involved in cell wall biosynthesis
MPLRDEEDHVGEQLEALAAQTYGGPWELVVVDHSRDRTAEIVRGWRDRLPELRLKTLTAQVGQSAARNLGVELARGEFVCSCDGNDVADPDWIDGLISAAVELDLDLVGGRQDLDLLNPAPSRAWIGSKPYQGLLRGYGFLPQLDSANMGVWTAVAREVGWDEDFRYGASDVAFAWRAQLSGKRIGVAEDAVMHSRLPSTRGHLMRQAYGYGKAGPLLYRKFRGEGMPRNLHVARYHWLWLLRNWRAPFSSSPAERGRWLRKASKQAGRLVGSVRHRVFFP